MAEIDVAEELRRRIAVLGRIDGVGVDVESVERFAAPDLRIFSPEEIAYCKSQPGSTDWWRVLIVL